MKTPLSFNEKLQWLKLYDHNASYTKMADKYLVREYVEEKIGNKYLIPLLGVYNGADDIDFSCLPSKFVAKCNHNSGDICICKDKAKLNIEKVRGDLNKELKKDYYLKGREWVYKNIEKKIVIEGYIEDSESNDLKDYKFMCFNGEVKCCFACSERFSSDKLKVTFFDRDWSRLPFARHFPTSSIEIAKPKHLIKMIELAEKLSVDIAFVRVDLYEVDNEIYFGEMTFFPGSGYEKFQPEEWDYRLGEMIDLSNI